MCKFQIFFKIYINLKPQKKKPPPLRSVNGGGNYYRAKANLPINIGGNRAPRRERGLNEIVNYLTVTLTFFIFPLIA